VICCPVLITDQRFTQIQVVRANRGTRHGTHTTTYSSTRSWANARNGSDNGTRTGADRAAGECTRPRTIAASSQRKRGQKQQGESTWTYLYHDKPLLLNILYMAHGGGRSTSQV
jgi:hypothetical protein